MDQPEGRPDGVIATQDETVARAAQDRPHSVAIGFDARGLGIVERATMHSAPEIRVELEVGAAPVVAHGPDELFVMLFDLAMRSVEPVPAAMPPSAEGHAIGTQ